MASSSTESPPLNGGGPPTPPLYVCIKSISTVGTNIDALSTRDQAVLISSLLGYCTHVARDQDTLAKVMCSGKEFPKDGLPFSEMPATRELLTNPIFFQCILSMLSYDNISSTGGASHNNAPELYHQKHGRKRSPSEDVSHTASRKKPSISPAPTGYPQLNQGHPRAGMTAQGNGSSKGQLAMKSLPVYAATILYSILQHAEHWPVQIMKAFAEDSFGARNWVDDERCKAFVSNLEASLKPKELNGDSVALAEEAEAYWDTLTKPPMPSPNNKALNGSTSCSQTKSLSTKEKRREETMKSINSDDGSSSSSGEEEVLESELLPSKKDQENSANTSALRCLFSSSSTTKERVRSRYCMHSLESTYEVIADAFQDRLNAKSKQNYRLLQVLPAFIPIPRVRCLASRHLERWLQSPALAGLARTLFAELVKDVRSPPLPDDLEMIDNILKLNLKANQLTMHIEHITMIAKRLPMHDVAKMIFTHCLLGERSSGSVSNALKPNDDHLRILRSVYAVLDRKLAADALASSVSSLTSDVLNQACTTEDFNSQLHSISCLLCSVVDALGTLYDGFHFVKAIIKAQASIPKTITSVNISSRLIFECTLLVTRTVSSFQSGLASQRANKKSSFSELDMVDEEELDSFRKQMLGLRKSILKWCVTVLCPVYHNKVIKEEQAKCADTYYERGAVKRGPGAIDFDSVLDINLSPESLSDRPPPSERMMRLVRCMLFLSLPDSKEMATFTSTDEEMDNDRYQSIMFCCQYGADIDDGIFKTILSSPNITPHTSISLIENLLLRCGSNSTANVDCTIATVKDMYRLTEYTPEFRSDSPSLDESVGDDDGELNRSNLPRLAVVSLWWRVSAIALVLSGVLPEKVGASIWEEIPTIRALIRMTTSQKYRFPTADCDEMEKDQVRQAEARVKQKEAKVAEILFMPSAAMRKLEPKPKPLSTLDHHRGGLRTSARQREKQERLRAIEEERRAEALHAENLKIRQVLKVLQKNIMIWSPEQDQRKPPKGSMDLLVSVNHLFDLAERFRLSTSPDFLLQTIGEGRSAIERAYDWLIPIISLHPNIIDRLQPSSSCFLLLRAYGAEGEKNRELLDLTAPLLSHVSRCLSGELGKQHALHAMELLLQDIADESADRRRCARKVLQKTIGDANVMDTSQLQYDLGQCGWSFQMMYVTNSKELIPLVIKYLCQALAFERGRVLMNYILALSEYTKFLDKHKVEVQDFDFDAVLCELISTRPTVCSDAFDRYPDLRVLTITKVKYAFEQAVESQTIASSLVVAITIPRESGVIQAVVSSNLLHAAIILISNWKRRDGVTQNSDEETAILRLLTYLVIPYNGAGDSGLSSAWYKHNQKRAVTVEEWVLLAKARAENVAKHAALSAPSIFLPRLLLCCGLSGTSFRTMLSRLDKITESGCVTYDELISPNAVNEWGIPGIGSRRVIKRKLHGRILAYTRIHTTDGNDNAQALITPESSLFLSWLSSEINNPDSTTKSQAKTQALQMFTSLVGTLKSSLDSDGADVVEDLMEEEAEEGLNDSREEDPESMSVDKPFPPNDIVSTEFINKCISNDQYDVLEESLDLVIAKNLYGKDIEASIVAAQTLLASYKSFRDHSRFIQILLKWVPLLTQDHGFESLWNLIFIEEAEQAQDWSHFMSLVCECASQWSDEHIAACHAWIFSQETKWKGAHSLDLVLRFIVLSSEPSSIHCFGCDNGYDDDEDAQSYFSYDEKSATYIINLALNAATMENKVAANDSNKEPPPDWLKLILLVGKSYQAMTARLILEKVDETRPSLVLSSLLLQLYIMHPLEISLSNAKLRKILLQASIDTLPQWLDWSCPLDDQLSEMLCNLTTSPHQRLVQSVTDLAKQHPLIFVRHLKSMSKMLLDDGSGRDSENQSLMKRGRIFGKHPSGDAVAQIGDQMIKVTVVMWGYSFNEPIWTSVLDILLTLPVEVIFSCGTKMGLFELLEAYLTLFMVQIQELRSESNVVRLREKFIKLLESFKKYKANTYGDWVEKNANIRPLLTITGINA